MVYRHGIQVWYTGGIQSSMTAAKEGARERYEAKTKVVTFRVSRELFDQLEEVKSKTGLSNSDLIKLGAGIAEAEIKAKLADVSGLEGTLAELRASIVQHQQRLTESVAKERRRQLEGLDTEIKAFRLFDRGWRVEEVSFKLGIPQATVFHHFQEWAQERKDKRALERELLRACLKRHIAELKDDLSWARLWSSTPKEQLEELKRRIDDCQRLLATPSRIAKPDREFLLAEYSARVLSVTAKKTTGNTSCKAPEGGINRP